MISALCLFATVLTALATGWVRKIALSRKIMDIPNSRSSHELPTPRGGGVAVVMVLLVSFALLMLIEPSLADKIWIVYLACLPVAVIGLLDDFGHIAARWRLLVHFSAISLAVFSIGGLPGFTVLGLPVEPGVVLSGLAVVAMVWFLNLFNFMDGIDGIAGIEVATVGLSIALLSGTFIESSYWILPLVMSASAMGFLFWNFPPAKIFMGDAGSGFLGALLAVLAVLGAEENPELLWCWLILTGVFVVDATLTLIVRLKRGEKVYQAHRSHAYQNAAREYGGHLPVTMVVAVINLGFLLPVAILVMTKQLDGLLGTAIAYVPLCLLAFRYKSGVPEAGIPGQDV